MGSIIKNDSKPGVNWGAQEIKKIYKFRLHLEGDLCIIIARPPPRWAKWSRGVRTRGLRVGLVGGPRPLFVLGPAFFIKGETRGTMNSAFGRH